MFGTKALLAVAIATTALSGSVAFAAPATRQAQTTSVAPMKAKTTKTTTHCRRHNGKYVKCAKTTRTTATTKAVRKPG